MVRAVYVISVAAQLTGVHPQTLRSWEREGVIRPERSQGGARRYSDDDIALARRVRELLAQGVSVPGVRLVLQLEAELASTRAELDAANARLREAARRAPRDTGGSRSAGRSR